MTHTGPEAVQDQHPLTEAVISRARNGNLIVFAVLGFMQLSWLSRLPDIKQTMDLTPGQLSLLLLAFSTGALTGLPLGERFISWLGTTKVVWLGAAVALPGVIFAAIAVASGWPLVLVMLGLLPFGFGIGIWDVAMNLEGSVIEQAQGRSIMPWFHAAYSGGAVATALITALLIRLNVPLLLHMIAMAVVCIAAVAWGTARYLPATEAPAHEHASEQASPRVARSAWTEPRTLLIGLMTLCAAFIEGVANDWTAVAFVDGHGVSTALGVLALTVFLVFWTGGRIFGARLLDRFGRLPVLRVLFVLVMVGTLMVVFGPTPVAFVGAAVWGIGASLGFPVGISAASDDPKRAAARISVVATIGYGAFLAGPAVVGYIGDHVGVLRALTVVVAVAFLALLVAPAAKPLSDAD